jgi:transposase-like protein
MVEGKARKARTFRSKADILNILQEQIQSGQNIKSYCAAHGIAGGAFHRWKQKYGMGEDLRRSGFASLHVAPEPGLFAIVGNIRIYQPVSAAYLKELMS